MNWIDFGTGIFAALFLGGVIGLERQWRQRMTGLRTNGLVAVWPLHGFGDCFGILVSFLLDFTKGRTNCGGIKRTSCPCSTSAVPRSCATAGFHADEAARRIGEFGGVTGSASFASSSQYFRLIQSDYVKGCLSKIDAECE